MTSRNLDIDALRSLVAIADTMSFSRAADRVCLSQSAVSLQIGRLERTLGKPLLNRRKGRLLGITESGEVLLRFARQILALNDAAYTHVAAPEMSAIVRLGVPSDFFDRDLPSLLRQFEQDHGRARVEVETDLSARLEERAARGDFDLAFFKRGPGGGAGRAVAREPLVWVAGPSLAWSPGEPLPLVLFPEGCTFRRHIIAALDAAGLAWRVAAVCSSLPGIRAALDGGLGVSALAPHLLSPALQLLDRDPHLPALRDVEVALAFAPERRNPLAEPLGEFLVATLFAGHAAAPALLPVSVPLVPDLVPPVLPVILPEIGLGRGIRAAPRAPA